MSISNIIMLDNNSLMGNLIPFRSKEKTRDLLTRDLILKIRDRINSIINSQGWFFPTEVEKLNLGEPYQRISWTHFKLKPEWSVEDVFKYWETHPIQIDCLIVLDIVLLYILKEYFPPEELRSAMEMNLSCGLMNTGIHSLMGSAENIHVPLCDLDSQRTKIKDLPAGCYVYIRGPMGWYDWMYHRSKFTPLKLESIHQGENALSLGRNEFLTFSRDYNGVKFPHPQLVIKSFDYILEELQRNGWNELSKVYSKEASTKYITPPSLTQMPAFLSFKDASKFQVAGVECIQQLTF